MTLTNTATVSQSHSLAHNKARTSAILAATIALTFGVFMFYGVGFAQPNEIHNAAHDMRHSNAFPCH
jgi:cobalt transporter subunit CbtB|tara:strand:- start:1819 stop:2019 length:201 start_codon:yes stop_codon:yes gene_type:complete